MDVSDAAGAGTTTFTVASYSSTSATYPDCAVSGIALDTSFGDHALLGIADPAGDGNYFVTPTDLTTHKEYKFKVIVSGPTNSFTSKELTLDVGCSKATVTQDSSLLSSYRKVDKLLDSTTADVFTFVNPSIDLTYCLVVSNALTS